MTEFDKSRYMRTAERAASRIGEHIKGITEIDLFGSVAREEHGPDSDIDLLVITNRVGKEAMAQVLLEAEIAELLKRNDANGEDFGKIHVTFLTPDLAANPEILIQLGESSMVRNMLNERKRLYPPEDDCSL